MDRHCFNEKRDAEFLHFFLVNEFAIAIIPNMTTTTL